MSGKKEENKVVVLTPQQQMIQELQGAQTDSNFEWIMDTPVMCKCTYLKIEGAAQSSGIKPELVVNISEIDGQALASPQRYRAADPSVKSEDGVLPKANSNNEYLLAIRFGKLKAAALTANQTRNAGNPFAQQQANTIADSGMRIVSFATPDVYKKTKDNQPIVGATVDIYMLEEAVFNNRGLINKVARRKSSYQNNAQAMQFAAPSFSPTNNAVPAYSPTTTTEQQQTTVDIDSIMNAAG